MKIKRFITFIAMMLFFTIGFANEGIPNTLITKNPEKEITTVKTKRRKEYAELNIEINKIKTKNIAGVVNGEKNEMFFDITHIDTPITDKDFIFVTEELETFPSYSETAGKKRWSNVMKKYKDAYMSKVPVDNNGLKYSTDTVVDEIEGTRSKTLKVTYENPPKGIFIGIVDGEDYSLKAVYKFLPDIDLYNQKAGDSIATITFSDKVFEDMTVANLRGARTVAQQKEFEHIKFFEEIKIIKEKGKALEVQGGNNKYITLNSTDTSFLEPTNGNDYSKVTKLKITNMRDNSLTLEVSKNQMSTLPLSDGSVFKIQFTTVNGDNNKLELTVIPVVFGTDPESVFEVELLDNNGAKQSYGKYTFNLKYPSVVTHNGIAVASKDGTKNTLSPNSRYSVGGEDDEIIEKDQNGTDMSTINPDQKKLLGDQIGLVAKGKSLKYLFYLLATNSDVLDIKITDSKNNPLTNGNSTNGKYEYTYDQKNASGTTNGRQLKFIIDKTDGTFNMQVPKWDRSKILEKFNLVVYMKTPTNKAAATNGEKVIYKVPITINLPATVTSKGKIDITFFARYEREFNKGEAELHLITPVSEKETPQTGKNKKLDFLSINVEGDYPYSKNLVGAKKFTINEKNGKAGEQNDVNKDFGQKYENIELSGINGVQIRYKQSIGTGDGIYLAFDEANWKKFIEKNTYGTLNIKVKNDYGHVIGDYEIRVHNRQKRSATFYLNGLESLFEGPVPQEKISTGKIFGLSNHIPYSEKDTTFTDNNGNTPRGAAIHTKPHNNIKTGRIFGATVTGDELRYYDIIVDGKTKVIIRAKSENNTEYSESTVVLSKDKEIDVLTSNGSKLFIGFREQEYNKRDIDGAKKELAFYFRLVNYDTKHYYFTDKTINIAIEKDGVELYRDEINIKINKNVPKETGVDINILKYQGNDGKEYYGRTFIVDGDQLKEEGTNEIFGSVNITGSAGDFPMDLTGINTFVGKYRVRYEGANLSYGQINSTNISQIKQGYKLPIKDYTYKYDNNITIWNGDDKKFRLKVDKSPWEENSTVVTYLTTDLELELHGKTYRKYNYSFFERTNPKHIKGLGEMKISIKDGKLDDYIRDYILGDKKLEITSTATSGNSPSINGFDNSMFDINYNRKNGSGAVSSGRTNIFNMANGSQATTAYYKFYNDYRLIGTGSSSMLGTKAGEIAEDSKQDISFLDGTKIKFGFSVGKSNTEQQKLLYSLSEFGNGVYNNSQTYKTSVHLDGGKESGGGAFAVTDIDFTVPKLDYSKKKADITSKQTNKNGLRPDMSFYFGLENGKFSNGGTNKRATDKDVLQITGGDFPYAILRANEIPISTLDSFIEFYDTHNVNVVKEKAKYINGRWEFRYDNGGLLTFEIVGKNGDGVGKNMIKIQVRAWDHSLIDKRYKMRVYSKNRKNYFEVPINVNIKPTSQVKDQKLEIKFDNKYKDIADVYTGRFTFNKKNNGKNEFELKGTDGTANIGVLSGAGLANFTPKKTDDLDVTKNRLLNGNSLEIEVNGQKEVLGKGGIFKLKNGLEAYIGYRDITGGEELEMAVGKWSQTLDEKVKLIVKNDYGVEVASYDITLKGDADVKDSLLFNFGTINSAVKNNITTVEKSVTLSAEVNDIKLEFSDKNPVLTLNGKDKNSAADNEKLHILNFGIVYVEKDRLNPKKWNFRIKSEIEQISSGNRKKEGKYTNKEELNLNITVKDSAKGSRAIKNPK